MRKPFHVILALTICLMPVFSGCQKQEEAVISVTVAEPLEEESAKPLDKKDASSDLAAESAIEQVLPGAVFGEEEVLMYSEEQEIIKTLQRVQGNYGYSLAYEAEMFTFSMDETEDCLFPIETESRESAKAFLAISENLDYALEELADELVLNCEEECLVEEVSVGEEEYPAIWISYTEETEQGPRQVEYYLIGFENRVFQIELSCMEEVMEAYYDGLQIALSAMRLDSIAEG